jgi:hypothetical protein
MRWDDPGLRERIMVTRKGADRDAGSRADLMKRMSRRCSEADTAVIAAAAAVLTALRLFVGTRRCGRHGSLFGTVGRVRTGRRTARRDRCGGRSPSENLIAEFQLRAVRALLSPIRPIPSSQSKE